MICPLPGSFEIKRVLSKFLACLISSVSRFFLTGLVHIARHPEKEKLISLIVNYPTPLYVLGTGSWWLTVPMGPRKYM